MHGGRVLFIEMHETRFAIDNRSRVGGGKG